MYCIYSLMIPKMMISHIFCIFAQLHLFWPLLYSQDGLHGNLYGAIAYGLRVLHFCLKLSCLIGTKLLKISHHIMLQLLDSIDSSIFWIGYIDGKQKTSTAGPKSLVDLFKQQFILISYTGIILQWKPDSKMTKPSLKQSSNYQFENEISNQQVKNLPKAYM